MTSYIYNMVDTWASGGGPYTSIKMNATDNDVGSASLLMDLQVGGASLFQVGKSGDVTIRSASTSVPPRLYLENDNNTVLASMYQAGGGIVVSAANGRLTLESSIGSYGIGATATAPDVTFGRRAAANLRFGAADAAAPVAQTLSVQSVVAGTTNTAGTNLTITGSQGTGTGAGGSIIFQVAPAGSTGTAQNGLVDAATFGSDGRLSLARAAAQLRFAIDGTFISGNDSTIVSISNKFYVRQNTNSVFMPSDVSLSWSSSTSPTNVGDTVLIRDAANTLALRNGTAAQAFRVYNTTDGTNSEYGFMKWNGTTFEIGAEKSGTGSNRSVTVRSSSGTLTLNDGNSNFVLTSGAVSLGTRSLYELVNIIGQTGYSEMAEMTAPAAPATNSVRIYAVDNGSGKTQLMARFATGVAQQIAIEP